MREPDRSRVLAGTLVGGVFGAVVSPAFLISLSSERRPSHA